MESDKAGPRYGFNFWQYASRPPSFLQEHSACDAVVKASGIIFCARSYKSLYLSEHSGSGFTLGYDLRRGLDLFLRLRDRRVYGVRV